MKVNLSTLRRATVLAEKIEAMQGELNALLSGQTVTRKGSKSVKKANRFTPEQRAKISEGLRAKWAERKAAKAAATALPLP